MGTESDYDKGWNAALDAVDAAMRELWICTNDYERPVHEVVTELRVEPKT